jgi:hypothetical protein
MRSQCLLLATLALAIATSKDSFATATVSGRFLNPDMTSPGQNGEARLDLHNCGSNYPTVNRASIGTHVVYPLAVADGTWSGPIYRKDEISCNGAYVTWWTLTYWVNGRQIGPPRDLTIDSTNCLISCVVDNLTPITVYPTVPAPTGDNTYLRLDQGNWTTGRLPGLAFTGLPFLNLDKFAKGDAIYLNAACSFTSGSG